MELQPIYNISQIQIISKEKREINGEAGQNGTDGQDGVDGKSAYEIWLDKGNEGTEQDFLDSLKGADGRNGIDGQNGRDGTNGTNGQDGYTPVKGIDYYTPTEKNEIEADVTNRVSSLIPDVSKFITASVNNLVNYYLKSDTYNKTEVNNLISAMKTGIFRIVSTLPTPSIDTLNTIYLVPSQDPQTRNVKDEYITIEVNNGYDWEKIGSTAIDLTGYATESWVNTQISDFLTDTEIQQLINTAVNVKYTKPETGIPKTDLTGTVQTSLDKADTAIQSSNFVYDSTTQTLTITMVQEV